MATEGTRRERGDGERPGRGARATRAPEGLRRSMVLIGLGLFVSTLAQTQVLGRLPLQFLLKTRLHRAPEAMAAFFSLASIPWDLKPVAGLLTDSVPLFGTRRRGYLVLGAAAACGLWLMLGEWSRTFAHALVLTVLLNVAIVMTSTVSGGLLVEQGQRYAATGRLSSLRLVVVNAALVLGGPLGGFLAERGLLLTGGVAAAACFALVPATLVLLREPPAPRPAERVLSNTGHQLGHLFRSGTLWSAAGMLFLVQLAPGFVTPLFYYQTNVLHFTPEFIGDLAMVSGILGLGGALVYGWVCRRLTLRRLLTLSIALNVVSTVLYLGYASRGSALVIEGAAGLMATLAQLPLFDLAARATPPGDEALGYSVMMSVWNLGAAVSDLAGSWLFDRYHLGFKNLVWLNAGTTALVLLVVPLLPRRLVEPREGQQAAPAAT